jgi:hypothetical protein
MEQKEILDLLETRIIFNDENLLNSKSEIDKKIYKTVIKELKTIQAIIKM